MTTSFLVYTNIPKEVKAYVSIYEKPKKTSDVETFETKMKDFVIMEKMALEFYGMSKSSSNENLLFSWNDRGIYYWN
jgi:hypothetical protein